MSTPRMTEQELQEAHRRVRLSRAAKGQVRSGGSGLATASSPPFAPYRSKLEKKYSEHLDLLVKAGEIKAWFYEPMVLKLADDSRYRPDFLIVLPGGLERKPEIHETKGAWTKSRRDSMVRLKWAAQKYGDVFTFRLIEWNGHGWDGRYIVT